MFSLKEATRSEGQVSQITIVGTAHKELGLCNEQDLLAILKAIKPDVVFEEIRPDDHASLYRNKEKFTVEMRAILSYLKENTLRQVPVDRFCIPVGFKEEVDGLFEYVEASCKKYLEGRAKIDLMASRYGYRFLSSLPHIEMINEIDELLEGCVAQSGSDRLKMALSAWYGQLRKRESAMLDGIYEFTRTTSFKHGVYLVGAGHMSYLAKSIERRLEAEPEIVQWRVWSG